MAATPTPIACKPAGHCSAAPAAVIYERHRPETTLLYRVVSRELDPFLAAAAARGHPLPPFVERTFRDYLACGILEHGFVVVRCQSCGDQRLVAFSCKRRGLCPSCAGRRMSDAGADLVDHILPHVGIRQWVLTLPFPLRYRLAYDRHVLSPVLGAFVQALFRWQQRRARAFYGIKEAKPGAVTFVQRFGGALNLNVHFHVLALEGAYVVPPHGDRVEFLRLPAPTDADVLEVLADASVRIRGQLVRLGVASEGPDPPQDPLAEEHPLLAELYRSSLRTLGESQATAEEQTRKQGRSRRNARDAVTAANLCAVAYGASLHAGVYVPANDRTRLERLVRYTARPPLAMGRLEELGDGRVRYGLRHPWRDGTKQIVLEPRELMRRLAAFIPPPGQHQVRYHGILAPAAAWRDAVVPGGRAATAASTSQPSAGSEPANNRPSAWRPWAQLLRRVFAVDLLVCARCGGRSQVLPGTSLASALRQGRAPPRA